MVLLDGSMYAGLKLHHGCSDCGCFYHMMCRHAIYHEDAMSMVLAGLHGFPFPSPHASHCLRFGFYYSLVTKSVRYRQAAKTLWSFSQELEVLHRFIIHSQP